MLHQLHPKKKENQNKQNDFSTTKIIEASQKLNDEWFRRDLPREEESKKKDEKEDNVESVYPAI